jgi:hypothetical protein
VGTSRASPTSGRVALASAFRGLLRADQHVLVWMECETRDVSTPTFPGLSSC